MFDRIKDIIVNELDVEPEKINPDTTFTDDLGIDSLDLVDLLVSLEDELNISIPDEAVKDVHAVGDLARAIDNLN